MSMRGRLEALNSDFDEEHHDLAIFEWLTDLTLTVSDNPCFLKPTKFADITLLRVDVEPLTAATVTPHKFHRVASFATVLALNIHVLTCVYVDTRWLW